MVDKVAYRKGRISVSIRLASSTAFDTSGHALPPDARVEINIKVKWKKRMRNRNCKEEEFEKKNEEHLSQARNRFDT